MSRGKTNHRSDYIHSYPTRVARRTTGGMGRIRDYFVEQGLGPKDIPVAFVFHEVISVRRWVCILLTIPPVIGMYILP